MAVLTSHLVILTASLSLASSQTCSGVGYFPHPSDCSQFFRCTDIWATGQYQQYAFTCAEGTVFDASIRKSFSYLQLIFYLEVDFICVLLQMRNFISVSVTGRHK